MYKEKYLKYKTKYLELKNQLGSNSNSNIIQDGGFFGIPSMPTFLTNITLPKKTETQISLEEAKLLLTDYIKIIDDKQPNIIITPTIPFYKSNEIDKDSDSGNDYLINDYIRDTFIILKKCTIENCDKMGIGRLAGLVINYRTKQILVIKYKSNKFMCKNIIDIIEILNRVYEDYTLSTETMNREAFRLYTKMLIECLKESNIFLTEIIHNTGMIEDIKEMIKQVTKLYEEQWLV